MSIRPDYRTLDNFLGVEERPALTAQQEELLAAFQRIAVFSLFFFRW
jgi:hypothetical protein